MSTLIPKIGEEILAEAQAEAKRRIEEAEKEAKEKIEKVKVEAEKEAETVKAKALEEIKTLEGRRLSEARRVASIKMLEEKNNLIGKAFQEALKKLEKTVESEAYIKSLCSIIETTALQLGEAEVRVRLNSKDLKRKNEILKNLKLPSNLKITVDNTPINTVGGCILETLDGKIRIDETFEARVAAAEKAIKKEIAKILFAE
ncbi:MAG: hypothetical protein DRO36_00615 [Candidatus Hecatellales archaeon]|nr:MAG: hypothetical protein DRO36_00615 [Candidatus Hecatellales archaeon]